jgi:predicted ATPase/DNA-binding SARP family transcriptional activator
VPRLSIALLGAPRVEVDGRPLAVDTRKAIALVAYLAVTGQAHSRDTLSTLLWPEYDQDSARASLRRTLSALRKGLGPVGDQLQVNRERVALRADHDVLLDVERFTRLVRQTEAHGHTLADVCPACLQPLSEAADIYRGEFLAGFALRECPEFEDWQRYQAESFRRALASVLERLATAAASAGRHDEALAAARRWLALDPLHEPAHRQVMLAYAWADQRAAALRQYRACVRILDEELGVAALPETTQLAERLRENHTPPPPTFAEPVPNASTHPEKVRRPSAGTPGYPLVGRAREWEVLLSAYATAGERGCLVVLEGEAGIGKTRLAESFLDHVRAKGARVVAGRSYEGESSLAYGLIAEALRAALAQGELGERLLSVPEHWLSEAARLVPEIALLRPLPAPLADPSGAGPRLVEGLRQLLLALLRGEVPGVFFLDDVQWADDASLELLGSLVRRLREHPPLFLLTWRGEEVPVAHRVRQLVADARRASAAVTLTLPRLRPADVAELVSARVVGAERPTELASTLYQASEGLPMFLIAYLDALADGTQPPDAVPGSIRDLLRARLGRLSETARQLLATAAAIGHSFDVDTLRAASGRGEDETVSALDELIGRRLVREVSGDGGSLHFDFAHEQLRQVVYHETSLIRRRLLHRRVAEALRDRAPSRKAPPPDPAQIALHYQLAGHDELAAEYFYQAGEHARALHANAEALAHFRTALGLGYTDTATLHEALGDLLALTGAYAAATSSYDLAAAHGTPAHLGVIERKLGNVYARQGAWELAESHFQAALAATGESDVAERARLQVAWSLAAHRQGQADRARAMASQALKAATAANDPRTLAQCHNIIGLLARNRGDLEQAARHLEHALELATGVGDPGGRVAALNNLALLYAAMAQAERGLALLEIALGLCRQLGDRHQEAALLTNMADLLRATGHADQAVARLKQAVPILAEIGAESGGLQPEIWKLSEW